MMFAAVMDAMPDLFNGLLVGATFQYVENSHLVPGYRSLATNAVYHESATKALSFRIFGSTIFASHTQCETSRVDGFSFMWCDQFACEKSLSG